MLHPFPQLPSMTVDPEWRVAIVRSVWYPTLTQAMTDDALRALMDAGLSRDRVTQIDAPGSFEIPLLCQEALERGYSGVIAFGIVMQGDTEHAHHVTQGVAHGIMDVQLRLRKPILFEVLHVKSLEDATKRAVGEGAKGQFAARALLSSLANLHKMRS